MRDTLSRGQFWGELNDWALRTFGSGAQFVFPHALPRASQSSKFFDVIIGFSDSDQLLYHYTPMARAQRIFAERKLKFGRFTCTKDPKESKDWKFTLVGHNADELLQTPGESLSSHFSSALKTRTKVACFSTDCGPLSGDHTRDFHRRGFSKSRMWTQYADKHAGVCLVLDKNRLEKQIASQIPEGDELCGGLVQYVNRYFVAALEEGRRRFLTLPLPAPGKGGDSVLRACCSRLLLKFSKRVIVMQLRFASYGVKAPP